MNSKSLRSVNAKPSSSDSESITVKGSQLRKLEKPKKTKASTESSKSSSLAKCSGKKLNRKNFMQKNESIATLEVNTTLANTLNSTLRWGLELDDPVAEEERIRFYKENRHRRYIEHAQLKLNIASCSKENNCRNS